jgi:hypothetical protein
MIHEQAGLIRAVKQCKAFWDRPALVKLVLYRDTLPYQSMVLAIIFGSLGAIIYFIFINRATPSRLARDGYAASAADLVVSLSLACLIPIMLIVTAVGTGYFVERYAVGAAVGVALVAGLLAAFLNEHIPKLEAGVFVVANYSFSVAFLCLWILSPRQDYAGLQNDPLFASVPSQEQIVIADALTFSPTWFYSNPHGQARLHYLADLAYAVEQPEPVPEYSLTIEQPYGAAKIDDYDTFLAAHREFLLYCIGSPRREWVKNRLIKGGWHLIPIASEGTRQLYRVRAPLPMP